MLGFERDTRPKERDMARHARVDEEQGDATDSINSPVTRSKVTARPVTRVDSQVVESATWMMKALSVLDEPLDVITKEAGKRDLAIGEESDSAVTVVTGDATSILRTLPPTPPKRKRRHWVASLITLTIVTVLVATTLTVVTPLAHGETVGVAMGGSGPLGVPITFDQADQAPTGQWVAVIGAQPSQEDIGGGAGPGVKAPGSAGLPVSAKHVTLNKTQTSTSSGQYSPPPFRPWPPSYAYTPVPGYHSFTVYGSGGFYWWAFGQCTWWAQNKRRDENLTRMGNAQFWATGARARGYQVSSTPRAGATVVFQPGVQGAGGAGHVAHVEKVYPGGWFLISEMNFYWNGGGWGRVDYRLAHSGWGVQFIY
jgi:surface antigen